MNTAPNDEFVVVMVPQAYVMDVYALIAKLEGKLVEEGTDSLAGSVDSDEGDERASDWDADLVERSWTESPRSMKLVLRHLADAADEWVPIEQLAQVAFPETRDRPQFNRRQLAGALGAWGHRCSSRYKVKTKPFEFQWNHTIEMYEYRMGRHFAELYRPHFN